MLLLVYVTNIPFLIEQNEGSAEAAASDQTVWSRKQIGHAKPVSPQQTNSLFMGFSGAEKVNLLLSLEECLGPHEEDSGYNYRLHRLERENIALQCSRQHVSPGKSFRDVSGDAKIFGMIPGRKYRVSST